MLDSKKLAEMIYSVAQYDGYNTSILQTQKNLRSRKTDWKFDSKKDEYIFTDLVKAISYAKSQSSLTLDVFLGINGQMDSKEPEQPERPGVLRNNVEINVADYYPPKTVTEEHVQTILNSIEGHSVKDGWELYAKLAKLQAFDNGNKRTSLIAANLWIGALQDKTEQVLIIPTDFRRTQFDANLVYFYMANNWDEYTPDPKETLNNFVTFATDYTLTKQNTFEARVVKANSDVKDIVPEGTKTQDNNIGKKK